MADRRSFSKLDRLRTVIRDNILTGEGQAQTASAASIRPALETVDRSDRRGFQIPEAARRGGYFRRCLPASPEAA